VASSVREGNDPEHQFLLQSIVDLPWHLQFDGVVRYVEALGNPHLPGYVTADARLAWEYKKVEVALVGQNLAGRHAEFGSPTSRLEIPRGIYGKVTLRF
jgi:hypothetical protein